MSIIFIKYSLAVCSIFFFHKTGNFTPEMVSVIYGN